MVRRARPHSLKPAGWIAGLCSLCIGLGSAHAGGSSYLTRGIQAYDEGEMDHAEALLHSALPALDGAHDQATAWMFIGLVRAHWSDLPAARAAFTKALGMDPLVSPDADRIAPDAVRVFEEVRRSLTGHLHVEVEAGALVRIDGQERGRAPLVLALPIGRRRIHLLSADGLRALETEIVVSPRVPRRLQLALSPRVGRVRLEVQPASARVLDRGRPLVMTPSGLRLPAGAHRLTVSAPGFIESSHDVVVPADETLSIHVSLQPAPPAWYKRRRTWGWISLGLSGAAFVTGALVARSARASEEAIGASQRSGSLDYDRLKELAAGANGNALAANVLFGVGAAAGVAGLVLVLTSRSEQVNPGAWRVMPAGAGLSLGRDF